MRKAILVLPLVLLALFVTAFAQQAAKPRLIISEIPVQALTSNPAEFDQAVVEVRGRLRFAGRDYFTDPVFVLEDSIGNKVEVSAWAPLEIPPLPPDLPRPARIPPTMRDYLGKTFLVQGLYSATDASIAVIAAAEVPALEPDNAAPAVASPYIRALSVGPPQPMDRRITPQPGQPQGSLQIHPEVTPNSPPVYWNTSGASAESLPNLTPHQPEGWSDKIVLSKDTGTHTDSSGLCQSDGLYVDFAVTNNGASAALSRFYIELYVDELLRDTWYCEPPLNAGSYAFLTDYLIGSLPAGSHTIRLRVDSTDSIAEGNETDNEYTKTILIASCGDGAPNLTPYQPFGWTDKIVVSTASGTHTDSSPLAAGSVLYVDFAIANNGTAPAYSRFYTELYVDGLLRETWYVNPPVSAGQMATISDYVLGTLPPGTHTLRIKADSTGAVTEADEADNDYTKTITIDGTPGAVTKKVLVLLVDFPDRPGTVSAQSFRDLLFTLAPSNPVYGSLRDYFREASYNQLDVTGDVNPGIGGWIRLPQNAGYYAGGCYGVGLGTSCPSYPENAKKMAEDAVAAALALGLNFAPYDADSNGYVDALFIVHAGHGGDFSGHPDDIWSHMGATSTRVSTGALNSAGNLVYVSRYTAQPEFFMSAGDLTIGVYAHEYSHTLGLPDLYDRDLDPTALEYDSNGIGKWSLMAAGSWNGSLGNSPAHPDPWCKWRMGWITPTPVTSILTNEPISQATTSADVYQLLSGSAPGISGEYFLVENRQQTGFDRALPGSGLMIWHVDESQSNNDNQWYPGCSNCDGRYKVALEQADGHWDLEHAVNNGDVSDPFPGLCSGQPCNRGFSSSTTPNSSLNAGTTTGVSVSAISDSAATMTATLSVAAPPCGAPDAPALSAPSTVAPGENYTISWTATSSESLYVLEESTSADFSGAESWTLSGTSKSVSHPSAGTYYSRVRARIHCSGVETDSAWSNIGQTQVGSADVLSLVGGRFSLQLTWRTPDGHTGNGRPVAVSANSGYFWFFGPGNVELFVKILDGRGVNGNFWVFYGALTNVEYTMTVTDTQTGTVKTYFNPQGVQAGLNDVTAFSGSPAFPGPDYGRSAGSENLRLIVRDASSSGVQLAPLFLQENRFQVDVTWRTPGGASGSASGVPLTGDSGYFWFFDASNVELVAKIVDGRGVNGYFWFFYGSLTDIQITITVTDLSTGVVRVYTGQQGDQQSGYDLLAF